jgi:hypothetical protein
LRDTFDGGPPRRLARFLGLAGPNDPRLGRRTAAAVLVAWAPLMVLGLAGGPETRSILDDFAVHARFAVALPLLVWAERGCGGRLGEIAAHFAETGLVRGPALARFETLVASTRRLRDSLLVEIGAVIAAAALVASILRHVPEARVPQWYLDAGSMSLAGWWHTLVSLPLLVLLLIGWLWRVFLWARFLWRVAKLELRLVPPHPDRAAGLRFVGHSLAAFDVPAFAVSVIAAGTIANTVIHGDVDLESRAGAVAAVVLTTLALFVGPLLAFSARLFAERMRGAFQYGALAAAEGREFERKWLDRPALDEHVLEVPDFSATTDLFQTVSNVYAMRIVPIDGRSFGWLVASAIMPFLPLPLAVVPFRQIVVELAKALL